MKISNFFRFAAAVGSASASVFRRDETNCSALKGPLIPPPNDDYTVKNPNDSFIFVGDWSPKPLQEFQNRFMNQFLPAWWNSSLPSVMEQYGVNRGTFNPSPFTGRQVSSSITGDMIEATLKEGVANGTFPVNNQFSLLFAPGTSIVSVGKESTGSLGKNKTSCNDFEGYHGYANQTPIPFTIPYNAIPFTCDLTSKNPNTLTSDEVGHAVNDTTLRWGHEKNEMDGELVSGDLNCEGADMCQDAISTLATPYGNVTVQGFYSNIEKRCVPLYS